MIHNFDMFNNFVMQKVLPLVYDESLSYYEVLTKLTNYVNDMVKSVNDVIQAHNDLSGEYTTVLSQLNDLNVQIEQMKTGFFIQDGSIELKKLSQDCLNKIQEFCVDTIHNIAKFVWFGLNDDGYFIAIIPSSWSDLVFGTDENGNLTLSY